MTQQYFLSINYDVNDILFTIAGFPNSELEEKYRRHRLQLFYKPFQRVEARRVWGAQSPIELFLIQELGRRQLFPQIQMLVTDDGNTYPSFSDLWNDLEFRHAPRLITEADMYFPEKRVAVFCDSTKYHRGSKKAAKDAGISKRLQDVGITPVRVPGGIIVRNLSKAGDMVCEAVSKVCNTTS